MTSTNNPLYIRIPRKIREGQEARWEIVRRCNGSRRKMIDFICGLGGYIDRHDRFAIEFNVKAHGADLSEEKLWKMLTTTAMASEDALRFGPAGDCEEGERAAVKALFSRVYKENEAHLWDWGQEEAYEGWRDSDTPYETWIGERVDWKFELRGRSGGHLVMTECEGIDLRCSPEDLEEALTEVDDGAYMIRASAVRKLFIICVQNLVELTPKAASEEIEYRAAWRLWVSFIEDQIPAMLEAYRTRQRLGTTAGEILDMLQSSEDATQRHYVDSFKTICILADINIEE